MVLRAAAASMCALRTCGLTPRNRRKVVRVNYMSSAAFRLPVDVWSVMTSEFTPDYGRMIMGDALSGDVIIALRCVIRPDADPTSVKPRYSRKQGNINAGTVLPPGLQPLRPLLGWSPPPFYGVLTMSICTVSSPAIVVFIFVILTNPKKLFA